MLSLLPLIQYVPTNNATDNISVVLQVVNRTFDVVNSMKYSTENFAVSNGNQLTESVRSLELDECYQLVLMEVELNQTTELYRQNFSESFQLLSPYTLHASPANNSPTCMHVQHAGITLYSHYRSN